MSWSLSVSPVAKDQFAAAVDAALPSGQPEATNDHPDVVTAKDALKRFAKQLTFAAKIGGSASGHVGLSVNDSNGSLNANAYASK